VLESCALCAGRNNRIEHDDHEHDHARANLEPPVALDLVTRSEREEGFGTDVRTCDTTGAEVEARMYVQIHLCLFDPIV
jgi:hypothetical protein